MQRLNNGDLNAPLPQLIYTLWAVSGIVFSQDNFPFKVESTPKTRF